MNEVVDLFEEEMMKEDKRELKKIQKEKKKEKKQEKKLEKFEDEEFAKMLKEEKKDKEEPTYEKKEKKHTFLNILLGISIIILFLASADYAVFNIIKGKELEQILTSSALCITSTFYILSILVKKEGVKKFLQILATLSIASYMCYYLFIA